jgi:hypothetical protein
MVQFSLQASRRLREEDSRRAARQGESSRSAGASRALLTTRIGIAAPVIRATQSLGARIGGSTEARVEGASTMGVKSSLVPVSPMPSQTPPDSHSTNVASQAAFCLQHIPGAARSEGSHTYVQPDTLWNGDATPLWLRRNSDKVWYWNSGLPLQLAREATEIPFDQRSQAQRWAVREATCALVLPEDFATPEPDIERMAQRNKIPHFL